MSALSKLARSGDQADSRARRRTAELARVAREQDLPTTEVQYEGFRSWVVGVLLFSCRAALLTDSSTIPAGSLRSRSTSSRPPTCS